MPGHLYCLKYKQKLPIVCNFPYLRNNKVSFQIITFQIHIEPHINDITIVATSKSSSKLFIELNTHK